MKRCFAIVMAGFAFVSLVSLRATIHSTDSHAHIQTDSHPDGGLASRDGQRCFNIFA